MTHYLLRKRRRHRELVAIGGILAAATGVAFALARSSTRTWRETPRCDGVAACRSGCEAGDARSCGRLGDLHARGNGIAPSLRQAHALSQQACDGDDAHGCSQLATADKTATPGDGDRRDELVGRAHRLHDRDCNAGFVDACLALAWDLSLGRGASVDKTRAASLMTDVEAACRVACNAGTTSACSQLGQLYADRDFPRHDPVEAVRLQGQACDAGDGTACALAGYALEKTDGNEQQANAYLERACEADQGVACATLLRKARYARDADVAARAVLASEPAVRGGSRRGLRLAGAPAEFGGRPAGAGPGGGGA